MTYKEAYMQKQASVDKKAAYGTWDEWRSSMNKVIPAGFLTGTGIATVANPALWPGLAAAVAGGAAGEVVKMKANIGLKQVQQRTNRGPVDLQEAANQKRIAAGQKPVRYPTGWTKDGKPLYSEPKLVITGK